MSEVLDQFGWWSVLDIILVAVAIYHILLLIRGTRTAQMLTGIIMVMLAFIASSIVPLTTVNWVLSKFYSSIIVIIIILFQDDIRLALSRIGKKPLFSNSKESLSPTQVFDELNRAANVLASNKVGALIVIERNIILTRYVEVGILVDANISQELLISIFNPSAPIHDGAVIMQQGRIAAAGCFLPLTKKENLALNLGTRHRAAIGISQETDAAVILISEEKGTISLVLDGDFYKVTETKSLKSLLQHHLVDRPKYVGGKEPSYGGQT